MCLFVAGVGYVLHLIAGFGWPGYPLETWQSIAATFGIWLVGGLLFTGAWSCLTTNKFWGEVHGSAHQLATHEGDPR